MTVKMCAGKMQKKDGTLSFILKWRWKVSNSFIYLNMGFEQFRSVTKYYLTNRKTFNHSVWPIFNNYLLLSVDVFLILKNQFISSHLEAKATANWHQNGLRSLAIDFGFLFAILELLCFAFAAVNRPSLQPIMECEEFSQVQKLFVTKSLATASRTIWLIPVKILACCGRHGPGITMPGLSYPILNRHVFWWHTCRSLN